jgi:hypothetical protein
MLAKILALFHFFGFGLLLVMAIVIARTYCENFGCIGLGVMWAMWAVGFTCVFGGGFIAMNMKALQISWKMWLRRSLIVQGMLGVVLLLFWGVKSL